MLCCVAVCFSATRVFCDKTAEGMICGLHVQIGKLLYGKLDDEFRTVIGIWKVIMNYEFSNLRRYMSRNGAR